MGCKRFFRGKYYQGSLSDADATAIFDLVENYNVVPSLKNIITNIPYDIMSVMIEEQEEYEKQKGSLEGYISPYELNYQGTLEDKQTVGVAFLYLCGSGLLGDSVGLGKTVQAAGLVNLLARGPHFKNKEFRFLFLTEKSNVIKIRNKMMQFTGEYVGYLEDGTAPTIEKYLNRNKTKRYYSVVGSHSLLTSAKFQTDLLKRPFDIIFLDESSFLRNTTADIYKAVKQILKVHKRKILLNATPMETEARDLYNQLTLLDDDYLPTVKEFQNQYCKTEPNAYGGFDVVGYKDNAHEFREATKLRYLGRTRADNGATYADNMFKSIYVPLSVEQKLLMEKTSLYQMAGDFPPAVNRDIPFNIRTTPKAGALLSIIDEVDIKKDKMIIYCRYIEAQRALKTLLESLGYKVALLNGQDTKKVKVRTQIVDDLEAGVVDILITNVQKGLDLGFVNVTVLYTIDRNPQAMVQLEGRMTRQIDVIGKSLYLLIAMGNEKQFVEQTLKMRITAAENFMYSGQSLITQAIKSNDNKEIYTG